MTWPLQSEMILWRSVKYNGRSCGTSGSWFLGGKNCSATCISSTSCRSALTLDLFLLLPVIVYGCIVVMLFVTEYCG